MNLIELRLLQEICEEIENSTNGQNHKTEQKNSTSNSSSKNLRHSEHINYARILTNYLHLNNRKLYDMVLTISNQYDKFTRQAAIELQQRMNEILNSEEEHEIYDKLVQAYNSIGIEVTRAIDSHNNILFTFNGVRITKAKDIKDLDNSIYYANYRLDQSSASANKEMEALENQFTALNKKITLIRRRQKKDQLEKIKKSIEEYKSKIENIQSQKETLKKLSELPSEQKELLVDAYNEYWKVVFSRIDAQKKLNMAQYYTTTTASINPEMMSESIEEMLGSGAITLEDLNELYNIVVYFKENDFIKDPAAENQVFTDGSGKVEKALDFFLDDSDIINKNPFEEDVNNNKINQ